MIGDVDRLSVFLVDPFEKPMVELPASGLDGNGIDMLEKILKSFPDMRALLSSGYTDKHNLLGMLEEYNVHFLQKPYPLPKLIETVGEILQDQDQLLA